jgi:acyl-coenzyme A thioesterase PaaI-like protein
MTTLEAIQEAFFVDLLSVPYHRRIGISLRREADGGARVTLPAGSDLVDRDGEVSPAALFGLGEAAAATELSYDVAPRVLEVDLAVIFLTSESRFRQLAPGRGTVEASSELVRGLGAEAGRSKRARRGKVDVAVRLSDESGGQVAEYESSFQVRFMETGRLRALVDWPSALVDLLDPDV